MKILFLTVGKPDFFNGRGIYTDLLKEFKKNNHELFIVYPIEKKLNEPTEIIRSEGVNILKVKIGNIKNVGVIEKGISTISLESLFLKAINYHYNGVKFDLILYSTPPITFEKIIKYFKHRDQAKSYLLLKDIFPQNAVDLQLFNKANPVYWFFRNKEKKLYSNSDYIGCMSPANVNFILEHNPNVNKDKIEVCPNAINPLEISMNRKKILETRLKFGLPLNKKIFVYGGNLGKPQGIDFIIDCLRASKRNKDSYFVIVGGGTEFGKLKRYFEVEKPINAKLIDRLPNLEYETLVNSCDVGLIFLDSRFTIPNFPSRLLSYMQASMPVLAATDRTTDIGKIIEEGNCGHWCPSDNVEAFLETLEKFSTEESILQMGVNAKKYLMENYTVDKSYDIIMKHFEKK